MTVDDDRGGLERVDAEQRAAPGLAARVRWTGSLPEAAVSKTLNAADVLLMPYLDGASLRRGTLMAAALRASLPIGFSSITRVPSPAAPCAARAWQAGP